MSGPPFDVRSSIPFSSGTTSVPLRRSGGTCLSGPFVNVRSWIPFQRG
ncbi:hypothetical protein THTE_4342 [Thermogutta terrifontis]|uniref:Uncharacterized protein n=1 Tax=Thermogutta terrifontis TaxID=1331910 RepID=A0A286RLU2_9BACT|nr:hypothetical protein THTE_4342 [Thermogutta terrifontis]